MCEARTRQEPGLRIPRDVYEIMLRAALRYYGDGALDETADIARGLILLAPQDVRAVKLLASTFLAQRKNELAEAAYEKAYAMDPHDPYTLVALSELKLEDLRVGQALPFLERLINMDPSGKHPAVCRGLDLVKDYYKRMR